MKANGTHSDAKLDGTPLPTIRLFLWVFLRFRGRRLAKGQTDCLNVNNSTKNARLGIMFSMTFLMFNRDRGVDFQSALDTIIVVRAPTRIAIACNPL